MLRADEDIQKAEGFYRQKKFDLAFLEFTHASAKISMATDLVNGGLVTPYGDQMVRMEDMLDYILGRLSELSAILRNGRKREGPDFPERAGLHGQEPETPRIATPRAIDYLIAKLRTYKVS